MTDRLFYLNKKHIFMQNGYLKDLFEKKKTSIIDP